MTPCYRALSSKPGDVAASTAMLFGARSNSTVKNGVAGKLRPHSSDGCFVDAVLCENSTDGVNRPLFVRRCIEAPERSLDFIRPRAFK